MNIDDDAKSTDQLNCQKKTTFIMRTTCCRFIGKYNRWAGNQFTSKWQAFLFTPTDPPNSCITNTWFSTVYLFNKKYKISMNVLKLRWTEEHHSDSEENLLKHLNLIIIQPVWILSWAKKIFLSISGYKFIMYIVWQDITNNGVEKSNPGNSYKPIARVIVLVI